MGLDPKTLTIPRVITDKLLSKKTSSLKLSTTFPIFIFKGKVTIMS